MSSGITKIIEVRNPKKSTPAMVNRKTGEMYISQPAFAKMTPTQRMFVMAHEAGHASLNTRNEILADNFATDYMTKKGYPLTGILSAETKVLDKNNNAHIIRANNLFNRLKDFDVNVNHTKMDTINTGRKVMVLNEPNSSLFTEAMKNPLTGSQMDCFKPFKFAKDLIKNRSDAKNEKIKSKAALKRNKGEAKLIKAQNNGEDSNNGGFLKKVGDFAKNIINKKQDDGGENNNVPVEPPKDNKKIYIIIAVVAIVLIIVTVAIIKMGKKK